MNLLHGDEEAAVDLPELVNLDEVGVREQAAQLGLVDEHLYEGLVLSQLRQHPLDDQRPLEPFGTASHRLKDLGHPSRAEPLQEDVFAERLRRRNRARARPRRLFPHFLRHPSIVAWWILGHHSLNSAFIARTLNGDVGSRAASRSRDVQEFAATRRY